MWDLIAEVVPPKLLVSNDQKVSAAASYRLFADVVLAAGQAAAGGQLILLWTILQVVLPSRNLLLRAIPSTWLLAAAALGLVAAHALMLSGAHPSAGVA